MTPHYVAIQNWTVAEVLSHLREQADKSDDQSALRRGFQRTARWTSFACGMWWSRRSRCPCWSCWRTGSSFCAPPTIKETAVAAFKKIRRDHSTGGGFQERARRRRNGRRCARRRRTRSHRGHPKLGGMEALDAPYLRIGLFDMIKEARGLARDPVRWRNVHRHRDELFRTKSPGGRAGRCSCLIISSGGNASSQATSLIIRALANCATCRGQTGGR